MPSQHLLARPHSFIVAEMKPLQKTHGFAAVKPERAQTLDAPARLRRSRHLVGGDLTTGLVADEVLGDVRSAAPKLPLVFAGLLSFETYQQTLECLAQQTRESREKGSLFSQRRKATKRWFTEGVDLYQQR